MSKLHDIITGICHVVQEAENNAKEGLSDEDFHAVNKTKVTGPGITFEIKDYAPQAFREVRSLFNITTQQFLESWHVPKNEPTDLVGSTGRSGSNFYKTPDKRFFFKTLIHNEVYAMLGLLKEYIQHFKKYPRSFIMKVCGMHRIIYGGEKLWIIIMGNILPEPYVSIDEKYDLKGRTPKPGKSISERQPISKDALKDNEISRTFAFVEEDRQFFQKQLKRDIKLLKNHNIMDYSLLVGIHHVTEEDVKLHKKNRKRLKKQKDLTFAPEERSAFEWQGLVGNNPGLSRPEVFFIGIIDCLTVYVIKKVMANTFKSVKWSKETLSTVPADYYAKRFLSFMTKRLLEASIPNEQNNTRGELRFSRSRFTLDDLERPTRSRSLRLDSTINRPRASTLTGTSRKNSEKHEIQSPTVNVKPPSSHHSKRFTITDGTHHTRTKRKLNIKATSSHFGKEKSEEDPKQQNNGHLSSSGSHNSSGQDEKNHRRHRKSLSLDREPKIKKKRHLVQRQINQMMKMQNKITLLDQKLTIRRNQTKAAI